MLVADHSAALICIKGMKSPTPINDWCQSHDPARGPPSYLQLPRARPHSTPVGLIQINQGWTANC